MVKKPVKITREAPAKREPESRPRKAEAPAVAANAAARPAVIVVGADKGGAARNEQSREYRRAAPRRIVAAESADPARRGSQRRCP